MAQNKVSVELKYADVYVSESEGIIPIINLGNPNNVELRGKDNKILELSKIIDKAVETTGFNDKLKTYHVRKFLGVTDDIAQDLAITVFNRYLEHSNIERAGGFITIWKREKSIDDIMKVSSDSFHIGGYCDACKGNHSRMEGRFKSLNEVELKCNSLNKWSGYNIIEE